MSIITDVQQVNTIIAFVEIFSHLIPHQTSQHDARCDPSSLSYIMAARRVLRPMPMELAWFSQCLLDIHQRQASEFSGAAYAAHTARAAPLWAQPLRAALSDERAGVSQRDRRRQTAPYRNAIGATHHFIPIYGHFRELADQRSQRDRRDTPFYQSPDPNSLNLRR